MVQKSQVQNLFPALKASWAKAEKNSLTPPLKIHFFCPKNYSFKKFVFEIAWNWIFRYDWSDLWFIIWNFFFETRGRNNEPMGAISRMDEMCRCCHFRPRIGTENGILFSSACKTIRQGKIIWCTFSHNFFADFFW